MSGSTGGSSAIRMTGSPSAGTGRPPRVATATSAALLQLKFFVDKGHTCRLLLPEDGWVPVEPTPTDTRLTLEGPGGVQLRVRHFDGTVGDRSLAVMFARAVKERFPFDDMAIQPTKPGDHQVIGRRTYHKFYAGSRDHSFESRNMNSIWWAVFSEGSATWVVETEASFSAESPAEIKSKMEQSSVPEIRQFRQTAGPPYNEYAKYFDSWKGAAYGTLERCIRESAFDADGLTPVIDADKEAADAKVIQAWNMFMEVAAW